MIVPLPALPSAPGLFLSPARVCVTRFYATLPATMYPFNGQWSKSRIIYSASGSRLRPLASCASRQERDLILLSRVFAIRPIRGRICLFSTIADRPLVRNIYNRYLPVSLFPCLTYPSLLKSLISVCRAISLLIPLSMRRAPPRYPGGAKFPFFLGRLRPEDD